MDEADQAQGKIEQEIVWALAQRKSVLIPTGRCWFCEEPAGRLFCSIECREDFERQSAAHRRNGA